ncbi:hypothetical protein A4X13_0g8276 [Tilletia indica]|uniref:Uncharacterized protein n=1 Tax=Tilletia indica TaxID=43049 RepID=A0A177TAM7_9BASI|nr:hypothetical protein A4X13_0g8276 [Tilletia indica]
MAPHKHRATTPPKKHAAPHVKRGRGRPKGSRNKPKPLSPPLKRGHLQRRRLVHISDLVAPASVPRPPPYQHHAHAESSSNPILVDDSSSEEQSNDGDDSSVNDGDDDEYNVDIRWDAASWEDVRKMAGHIQTEAAEYMKDWSDEQRARVATAFRACAAAFERK